MNLNKKVVFKKTLVAQAKLVAIKLNIYIFVTDIHLVLKIKRDVGKAFGMH